MKNNIQFFLIYSNEKEIVEQQQLIFNTLWEKAIPVKQRIKEIEEETKREFLDNILILVSICHHHNSQIRISIL